jgi:hypothetical protein
MMNASLQLRFDFWSCSRIESSSAMSVAGALGALCTGASGSSARTGGGPTSPAGHLGCTLLLSYSLAVVYEVITARMSESVLAAQLRECATTKCAQENAASSKSQAELRSGQHTCKGPLNCHQRCKLDSTPRFWRRSQVSPTCCYA